jgi:hypothetical protein
LPAKAGDYNDQCPGGRKGNLPKFNSAQELRFRINTRAFSIPHQKHSLEIAAAQALLTGRRFPLRKIGHWWRARRDSNAGPSASEADTLSS